MVFKKAAVIGSFLLILCSSIVHAMEIEPYFAEPVKPNKLNINASSTRASLRPLQIEANKNSSVTIKTFEDETERLNEAEYMERVLLQMFIVICGTAGVFVLCFVFCVQCLLQAKTHRNSDLPPNMRTFITFERDEENERNSFIPMHHHPWSPGVLHIQEPFSHHYDENRDKPPSYDDLSPRPNNTETPCSPPPPYSPSFKFSDSNNCNSDLK